MTTRYLDLVGGNDSNDGSTFALRKKTLASATASFNGNNTIRVMASPALTSMAQNASFTNGSDTVTLTTAVTANIDDGEAAWTASANVTSTADTAAYREGTKSAKHVIASGFTTGLVAYKAFSATDFSAYQQISLLVRTSANVAASVLQLKLCSDNAGVTAVNTINIPAITSGYWTPVVIDTAGALGSSIQSVALYAASDPGSVTVNLDNIIACKASSADDALTHLSLISKNTGGTEPWFAVDSINGTTIKLGTGFASRAAKSPYAAKYYGTTETVALYKREPIMLSAQQTSNSSGTHADAPLNIECGWNTTDMSTQTDVTWVRTSDPSIGCVLTSSVSCNRFNKWYGVSGANYALGFFQGDSHIADECGFTASGTGIRFSQVRNGFVANCKYAVGCQYGVGFTSTCHGMHWLIKVGKIWGITNDFVSTSNGIDDAASSGYVIAGIFNIDEIKNCRMGICQNSLAKIVVNNCVLVDNYRDLQATYRLSAYFNNCAVSGGGFSNAYGATHFTKYNQTANDHRIYWDDTAASTIVSATDQRHTASDISWKFNPLGADINSYNPLSLPVAKIACNASEARTVSLWFRRSNTGLSMRLRVPGGQLAGVASDVVTNASASANTWEQLTVNFTPTEAGVIEVFAEVWGGTTYSGWVDDLSVT